MARIFISTFISLLAITPLVGLPLTADPLGAGALFINNNSNQGRTVKVASNQNQLAIPVKVSSPPIDQNTKSEQVNQQLRLPNMEEMPYTTTKPSPPSGAVLNIAISMVNDVYRSKLEAATQPKQKAIVAQDMLALADSEQNLTSRYALLIEAKIVATDAGDYPDVAAAINAMNESFKIDAIKMMLETGKAITLTARTQHQYDNLAFGMNALANQALATNRYQVAVSATTAAILAAQKADDQILAHASLVQMQRIRKIAAEYVAVKSYIILLAKNAADPTANLAVGKFLCFIKGDWQHGLPMLALGSDPTLKTLAKKELVGENLPDGQMKLGDRWWAIAAQKGKQSVIQQHAARWYVRALPRLTGLERAFVEQRLTELQKQIIPVNNAPNQNEVGTPILNTMVGNTSEKDMGAIVLTQGDRLISKQKFRPPVHFIIVAETNSTNIRITYATELILNWEVNPSVLHLNFGPTGLMKKRGAGLIPIHKWVTIDLLVLPHLYDISVNGVERWKVKADFSRVDDPLIISQNALSTIKVKSVRVLELRQP